MVEPKKKHPESADKESSSKKAKNSKKSKSSEMDINARIRSAQLRTDAAKTRLHDSHQQMQHEFQRIEAVNAELKQRPETHQESQPPPNEEVQDRLKHAKLAFDELVAHARELEEMNEAQKEAIMSTKSVAEMREMEAQIYEEMAQAQENRTATAQKLANEFEFCLQSNKQIELERQGNEGMFYDRIRSKL